MGSPAGGLLGLLARQQPVKRSIWTSLTTGSSAAHLKPSPSRTLCLRLKSTAAAAATVEASAAAGAAAAASSSALACTSERLVAGVPDAARKQMAWWLWGMSAWVYTMVVIGGVTRLTRSGLSMTEWKFTGEGARREARCSIAVWIPD